MFNYIYKKSLTCLKQYVNGHIVRTIAIVILAGLIYMNGLKAIKGNIMLLYLLHQHLNIVILLGIIFTMFICSNHGNKSTIVGYISSIISVGPRFLALQIKV